jgi:hypothetical protein
VGSPGQRSSAADLSAEVQQKRDGYIGDCLLTRLLMLPGACWTARLWVAQGPVMNETPTQREPLTAHERRAKIIAQLHADAAAIANDWSARQRAIKESVARNSRRQRAVAWQFGAGIVLWILAAGYFVAHLP